MTDYHYQNFYSNLSDVEIEEKMREEGFEPKRFHNGPGDVYEPHQHPETALLAFLDGNMKVKVGEERFNCQKGDKLVIPGNNVHSAVVGKDGCNFFWSENLFKPGL